MAIKLENIVPFGRSLDEYKRIFSLSKADLTKSILGVGDGPASFNAEMQQNGGNVVSLDPIYCYQAEEIESRFKAVVDDIIEQVKASPDDWVWTYHASADTLRESRERALRLFLQDYQSDSAKTRYICGELPNLDFADDSFELALCSHLLFLYSDHLGFKTHLASIRQMLRVAKEVRLFPLLTLAGEQSPFVDPIIDSLMQDGYRVAIEPVDYEFQKGANAMLKVRRAKT